MKVLSICVLVAIVCTFADAASTCKMTSSSYSANDGTVLTEVAHLITFTAECPPNVLPAFANLNGRTLAVVRDDVTKKYQVSWTQELAKSSSGSYEITVFDDEGFQQLRKAQRAGEREPKPLLSLSYSHSSPYRGPFVQNEFAALLGLLVLSYVAISYRFKITSKQI
ncbi:hypothetical protein RDWZM_010517 [Blomia tropicalis]|uniref:Translocon-associated protein subunit delta n=1 Tax=Blomia tropicalis TaxID=40697 RepID=A0A9Q0M251_BLOTA|nr:SWI/SNF and RSC complex subunit Ssr4 [Blomia tropicalis]KAJ6216017.1 hypothetical protein RDWZM_010517 [Blomia tropicalis]